MDLIDLRYVVPLIEAGGVMPRWQDLPKSARITVHNLWRLNTMVDFGSELLAVLCAAAQAQSCRRRAGRREPRGPRAICCEAGY